MNERIVKNRKRLKYLLVPVLLLVPLLISVPASATSVYDNSLRVVSQLYAGLPNDKKDYSLDWIDFLLNPNSDYYGNGACHTIPACSSMQVTLQDAYLNGDFAVTQWDYIGPDWILNNTVESSQIVVNYSTEHDSSLAWSENHVDFCSDSTTYGVGIQFEQGDGMIVNAGSVDPMLNCVSEISNGSPEENYFNEYLFAARISDLDYPSGYAGPSVPGASSTPVLYSGTVDCDGGNPQLMSIYQPGNWGSPTLTPVSLGRSDWSYGLTDSPYSITVDCGGTLASSSGTVNPLTTSKDWVCDVIGTEPYYCVLS